VFGDFALDQTTRQLLRSGEPRHLEPKAFELLDLLVSRRPAAVAKAEIRDRLWPDTFVSESSLTGLVAQLRQALEDDPRHPRFVRTVHGFGYAFLAAVAEGTSAQTDSGRSSPRRTRARPVVLWEEKAFALADGENVLGRDDGLAVTLEWPGVSRRHARIVIEGDRATLEDLSSKNGTFLRDERLGAPAPLVDGDTFRLGRLVLVFRMAPRAASTQTEVGQS
jgi:DNA-binding winged helix-turn-helix (wHTH) protein